MYLSNLIKFIIFFLLTNIAYSQIHSTVKPIPKPIPRPIPRPGDGAHTDFYKFCKNNNNSAIERTIQTITRFLKVSRNDCINAEKKLKSLETLNLSYNQYTAFPKISNITPLRGLTNIKKIYLKNNLIKNISTLVSLTNLEVLNLKNNPIALKRIQTFYNCPDAGGSIVLRNFCKRKNFLYYCKNINNNPEIQKTVDEILWVMYSITGTGDCDENYNILQTQTRLDLSRKVDHKAALTTLEPLIGITNLEHINIAKNSIKDISPLVNMRKLESIIGFKNQIESMYPISFLRKLEDVDLSDNKITNANALIYLTKLEDLNLNNNNISDFSFLKYLNKDIRELLFRGNPVVGSLYYIKNLTKLKRLMISGGSNFKLSYLEDMPSLISLAITNSHISDFSRLNEYIRSYLVDLDLSYNNISDISFLTNFRAISTLSLSGNTIYDFSPLKPLANLRVLKLANTSFKSSDFLNLAMSRLQLLDISNNNISDLKELKNSERLISLRYLDLKNTNLIDLSGIEMVPNIFTLDISDNPKLDSISELENVTIKRSFNAKGIYLDMYPEYKNQDNCPQTLSTSKSIREFCEVQ